MVAWTLSAGLVQRISRGNLRFDEVGQFNAETQGIILNSILNGYGLQAIFLIYLIHQICLVHSTLPLKEL